MSTPISFKEIQDRKVYYTDVGVLSMREAEAVLDRITLSMNGRPYTPPSKWKKIVDFLAIFFSFYTP